MAPGGNDNLESEMGAGRMIGIPAVIKGRSIETLGPSEEAALVIFADVETQLAKVMPLADCNHCSPSGWGPPCRHRARPCRPCTFLPAMALSIKPRTAVMPGPSSRATFTTWARVKVSGLRWLT